LKVFSLSESDARKLVSEFGTPLYVVDEASFRARIRAYRQAWESRYDRVRVSYASKANSTLALLQIAHAEGLHIDVASAGELRTALVAGVPAEHLSVHGNFKSPELIQLAVEVKAGEIVVDSVWEAEQLVGKTGIKFVARVNPNVEAASRGTHAKIATGHGRSKFGMELNDLRRVCALLPISGLHAHLGSNFETSEPQTQGVVALVNLADELGLVPEVINVGGGLGVHYPHKHPPSFEAHAEAITAAFLPLVQARGWHAILAQEPGRALIAEAGVTLYSVGPVKQIGDTTFVAVDGGLFENPRPALYDAKYEVQLISSSPQVERGLSGTIVGSHCENDLLFPDVTFDRLPHPGDLIQVHCTGAYNASMASNYNRFPRPATVLRREDGSTALIQARETYDLLFQREQTLN
jgi:diaminopimelate decarboxylase